MKCPHKRWYYRAGGRWCPDCKTLFLPGTPEYKELDKKDDK